MADKAYGATKSRAYNIPTADAPELAAPGSYPVGVANILLTDPVRRNAAIASAINELLATKFKSSDIEFKYPENSLDFACRDKFSFAWAL